jgi:hypothetical protein
MKRLALVALAAGAIVSVTATAPAQQQGWLPPQWNEAGSAVCPRNFDFHRGWCKSVYAPGAPAFAPPGEALVRPQWNHLGSPVCPKDYDYAQGWCRPVYAYETPGGPPPLPSAGPVPPAWNSQGSAVCPENYDYYGGLCHPRG